MSIKKEIMNKDLATNISREFVCVYLCLRWTSIPSREGVAIFLVA